MHGDAGLQQTAHNTVNCGTHGLAGHRGADVTGRDLRADLHAWLEDAIRRGAHHALARVAADEAGNRRVGDGRPLVVNAPQVVAAHRLHRGVAVLARGEAGTYANHSGRHVARGTEVALGENCVHQRVWRELAHAGGLGVNEHGDVSRRRGRARRCGVRAEHAAHALHACLSQTDGLREAHGAPDGRGLREVAHHDLHARAKEPQRDARRDVPRPANHDQHVRKPPRQRYIFKNITVCATACIPSS